MRLPLVLVAALVLGPLLPAPASADRDDKAKRIKGTKSEKAAKEVKTEKERKADKADRALEYKFRVRDRDYVRSYWRGRYGRGGCPPGLVRSGSYCYPYGQAKKRWLMGYPLERSVLVQPVPPVLLGRLGPVPAGYRYGMVDGDVLLFALGTLLVVDAIDMLVD